MTLQTTPPISLTDVLNELRVVNPSRALPISLGDADVRNLAGKPTGPISLSDLYGKRSYVPMVVTGTDASANFNSASGAGTATCSPSVSVANGYGTKCYSWSFTSNPSGCTLSNATSAACTVSHPYAQFDNNSALATLQCVVTDDVASVTATNIHSTLGWS